MTLNHNRLLESRIGEIFEVNTGLHSEQSGGTGERNGERGSRRFAKPGIRMQNFKYARWIDSTINRNQLNREV